MGILKVLTNIRSPRSQPGTALEQREAEWDKLPFSLVDATPGHAPVERIELRDFAPIGSQFPSDGKTVARARQNLAYARRELYRWDKSIAIMSDKLVDSWDGTKMEPYRKLLQALEVRLDGTNCNEINDGLRRSLAHLRPWSGVVIRDFEEERDLSVHVCASHIILVDTLRVVGMHGLRPDTKEYIEELRELSRLLIESTATLAKVVAVTGMSPKW